MKNKELDDLTKLAEEVHGLIPELLLSGDGKFLLADAKEGDNKLSNYHLLTLLHRARVKARLLHEHLQQVPRRGAR